MTGHDPHSMQFKVALGLLLLVFGWCLPLYGNVLLSAIERIGTRLADRKGFAIFSISVATIVIRLSLLPFLPVPVPEVHDEFSYLLAADTFAHGRLANPPHPMWIYFDTFHVNQFPAYMSKYPPGQGAVLALGQLLGHPWIGVLLSMGAMCGAVLWMLQGWLPPRWALLGATLLMLRVGIFNYWMNSYWGGAVAAIGGALVVGALPRLVRFARPRDSLLLGLGTAILANSRPFEGLIFCLSVALILPIWLYGRRQPLRPSAYAGIIVPCTVVILVCGIFMVYYNWRGTGHPFLFPYVLNDRTYSSTSAFSFEPDSPPRQYSNPQFDAFYNAFCRGWRASGRSRGFGGTAKVLWEDARIFADMFVRPELCVPFVTLPWMIRDRRIRFLMGQFVFCFAGFLLVVWFQQHYAAPLIATTFALVTQGMRHLSHWRFKGRTVGVGLVSALVLATVVLAPFHPTEQGNPSMQNRARIASELNAMPGSHLVIIRYSATHPVISEWVYNAADIDRAKIVWAREIPGISMQPLLDYYRQRDVRLVEPDTPAPELSPYPRPTAHEVQSGVARQSIRFHVPGGPTR